MARFEWQTLVVKFEHGGKNLVVRLEQHINSAKIDTQTCAENGWPICKWQPTFNLSSFMRRLKWTLHMATVREEMANPRM